MAHPDDIKSVTGMVFRAMEKKSRVSLILVTKGEAYVSEARKTDSPHQMGERRIDELLEFLRIIGIPRRDFFLLGVPDGGQTLPALREDFFKAEGAPFCDPLLHTDRVPYHDAYTPDMLFYGETLLAALEELLVVLQPRVILTHHPKDDHLDHRAVSFFARKAASRLHRRKGLKHAPRVYAPLVYYRACRWPTRGDYFYTEQIAHRFPRLKAHQFCLTDEEFERKKEACMTFTPTLSVKYIRSNMKKDEVVWRIY